MAEPASREQLKQYALRALGKPVIEINADDNQLEDRIDEALQYFAQYHYDGIRRTYLKYKYTQADKDRVTTNSSESVTKNGVTTAWEEGQGYIVVPDIFRVPPEPAPVASSAACIASKTTRFSPIPR